MEEAFKQFDTDKSGQVSLNEFRKAMERFGLHVMDSAQPGTGGVPPQVLQALFDRYDTDASGSLTYGQFSRGLFAEQALQAETSAGGGVNPLIPSISGEPVRPGGPLHSTRPNSAYTRGRSLANPALPQDPDYFKKSSGIFR